METTLLFRDDKYDRWATTLQTEYNSADPFPYTVIDDFLPPDVCDRLLDEFPKPDEIDWLKFDKHHSLKLATKGADQFRPFTRHVMAEFSSARCLRFLEGLTGIGGLIPDPHFEGGGLHQIPRGGFLKVHTDFNYHRELKLDRRINLIVYLNKDWEEDYGGHLELWAGDMSRCVRKVLPVFNRCVVFNTTDWSYHGHPEKLTCPEGRTRKSLALYYYTNGRPAEEKSDAHGTMWQERPQAVTLRTAGATVLRGAATAFEWPAKLLRKASASVGTSRKGA